MATSPSIQPRLALKISSGSYVIRVSSAIINTSLEQATLLQWNHTMLARILRSAVAILVVAGVGYVAPGTAQTTAGGVPTLIPVSGEFRSANGQPRTGNVLLVVSLYE